MQIKERHNYLKIIIFLQKFIVLLLCFYSPVSAADSGKYSAEEHALLNHDNNPTVTAAVPASFPPFYLTDDEGLPYGMAIEVMNELDHHAGVLTKYIVKQTWTEVFKAIDSGEAQIIPNLGITEKRKKLYFFTKPYAKTDINVFSSKEHKIKYVSELAKLNIGVVKENVGEKIVRKNSYKNVHTYNSIKLAFSALIKSEIDVIVYPKLITIKSAKTLNVDHLIHDTGITLKTIHRAIAVSKKEPELFKKINTALNNYISTQNFSDTYVAWYGKPANIVSTFHLIIINIFVIVFSILLFIIVWRKKNLSVFKKDKNTNAIWIITLILILVTATSIVTFSTLWILYNTSFEQQRYRLIDSVKSRARLIEAVARYDKEESKLHDRSSPISHERTLSQIVDAHKNFAGFGETGEFTLARKNNQQIEFILRQRHSHLIVPEPVSFSSHLASPMRLALLGHSGTIVGLDYRGEEVLAAYEPVSLLNLGIVAKIDLNEIRAPFIRSALYILAISIIVSLTGSLLFFYIMLPIIKKIKETEQRFQQLFRHSHAIALIVDPTNSRILDANDAATNFYGYNLDELITYNFDIFLPDSSQSTLLQLNQSLIFDGTSTVTQHRLQNGQIRDVEIISNPVEINNELLVYLVITNITEKLKEKEQRLQLNKELEQARKMEALGQLTGGIAHDFNNMLGIIMGYTDLTQTKLSNYPDNKIHEYLDNVTVASNRAKELIASMMLFSRSGDGDYQTINISHLVKEDIKMLRSIIPTSVEIHSNINENLPAILIEPVKLQQLLMNLCVNARDAMNAEGSIIINLDWHKNVENTCLVCYENISGDWIELSVTDTGTGMSDDVVQHLFEPFFTTKAKGKGTGMGMAVVHGIVKDINAHIIIDTEIGKGTRINVLFKPADENTNDSEIKKETTISKTNNHERILIVDDEESLSQLLGDTLENYDYRCTCFSSPRKALAEFKKSPDKFDLIISDQTMPGLTGLEMVKLMREVRPDIPVIISTGYSESIDASIAQKNNILLFKKPLKNQLLLTAINDIFKV